MARKATDMLEVFRTKVASPAASREASPAGEKKRGFQGMVLVPRQIMLGSAVVVLLLVFTFVLGLSVGKRGDVGAGGTTLSAVSPTRGSDAKLTYVEARVPYMDPARHVANAPAAMRDNLARVRGVSPDHIWISDDTSNQRLRVLIGPFRDSEAAVEFLRRKGLFTHKLGGVLPWKAPDYRTYAACELPTSHLPQR
jgi:hypothetical protein